MDKAPWAYNHKVACCFNQASSLANGLTVKGGLASKANDAAEHLRRGGQHLQSLQQEALLPLHLHQYWAGP